MNSRSQWRTEDFDAMSWHDVHVHGLRIVENEGQDGSAELLLDIDYILEWIKCGTAFDFVIAQATLQFHEVFGLKVSLDYAGPGAGMCAFSLAGIERERIAYPAGHVSYRWRVDINWPTGSIEFESPGFTQRLTGQPVTQSRQSLSPSQRKASAG